MIYRALKIIARHYIQKHMSLVTTNKINALPDNVPELKELKEAKQAAALAFLQKLEEKLNANTDYVAITKELDELNKSLRIVQQAMWGKRRQQYYKVHRAKPVEKQGGGQQPAQTF